MANSPEDWVKAAIWVFVLIAVASALYGASVVRAYINNLLLTVLVVVVVIAVVAVGIGVYFLGDHLGWW